MGERYFSVVIDEDALKLLLETVGDSVPESADTRVTLLWEFAQGIAAMITPPHVVETVHISKVNGHRRACFWISQFLEGGIFPSEVVEKVNEWYAAHPDTDGGA